MEFKDRARPVISFKRNPDSEGRMTIGERIKLMQKNQGEEEMSSLAPDVLNYIGGRRFAFLATIGGFDEKRGHKVCIAVENEPGYVTTTGVFGTNNYNRAQATADAMNERMGLSKLDAFKIVASTMRAQDKKEKKFGKRLTNPTATTGSPGAGLYASFHGMAPQTQKTVYFEPPKGPMIQIGVLENLVYKPDGATQHKNVRFEHQSGDTGSKKLASNIVVATDAEGKNIYLMKLDPDKREPYFDPGGRGIIG